MKKKNRIPFMVVLILCLLSVNSNALNANAIEDEGEDVTENKQVDARVGLNYDEVCQGGGWKQDHNGNHNPTGKPNQNPSEELKYWDYTASGNPYNTAISEKDLIKKYWPKINKANGKDALYDAVIEPEYGCYYANPINGYGEHVDTNKDYYRKYDLSWSNVISGWKGTTPIGNLYQNPKTNYTGNYIYESRNGQWQNPFTIVTRAKISLEDKTDFYVDGIGFPGVYDVTDGVSEPIAEKGRIMYKFYNTVDTVGSQGKFPSLMGKYKVTIQTPVNVSKFRLPGRLTKEVNVMPKGYKVSFKKQFDNVISGIGDTDWENGLTPDPVDSEVQRLFGKSMYRENQEYKIPIPKYDEENYIFEGWEVKEEYITGDYQVSTKTIPLTDKNKDGKYEYTPSAVGKNAWFVLNADITAKFRSRKTDNVTVETQIIDGKANQGAVSVNPTNDQLKEGKKESTQFSAKVSSGYAYDFVGWSANKGGNHADLSKDINYQYKNDFSKQSNVHVNNTLYATFKPKKYTIKYDGNGGSTHDTNSKTATQDADYYNDVKLNKNPFVRDGYIFKGWSLSKGDRNVKYADQGSVYNIPFNGLENDPNGKVPNEVTLYAVWERNTSSVDIEKYKDSLYINDGSEMNTITYGDITIDGSITNYNVLETARFYLNVELATPVGSQKELDPTKFKVLWEYSKDNGKSWTYINHNSSSEWLTLPFKYKNQGAFAKVLYDEKEQKWFVPLLRRLNSGITSGELSGRYRVSVAYDDPKSTTAVATEEQFKNKTNTTGWSTGEEMEVKFVQSASAFINVPAQITLEEKTEVQANGTTKKIIESVHKNNKVTVNKMEHAINGQVDYDWNTPNTMFPNGKPSNVFEAYTTQQPFWVEVNWNGTLTDSSKQYTVENIEMYSQMNMTTDKGNIKVGDKIPNGVRTSFRYDGKEEGKTLYDFYLKGNKPTSSLPHGTTFVGRISFKVKTK